MMITLYPREYLAFVERILCEYPVDKRELKDLELTIEARCRSSSIPVAKNGRGNTTAPERVTDAKLNNRHYQFLSNKIAKIEVALSALRKNEADFVKLMFWDGLRNWEVADVLKINDQQMRRIKTRILRKVTPYVIGEWVGK